MNSSRPQHPPRMVSVDAYRGLVMFLMMAEVLHLSHVAKALPKSSFWEFLAYHQTHAEWSGCSLHDLIQPSFSFLVGVALPFSIASRLARGQSFTRMTLHAAWRAIVLVLLGVFLRSVSKTQTNWTFEDTLSQIGLGYVPLFLLGLTTVRAQTVAEATGMLSAPPTEGEPPIDGRAVQSAPQLKCCWIALGVILVGYWVAFALYPRAGDDFDYKSVGVPVQWPHLYTGFAAHWNKNTNMAWAFDTWFLNLFPREKPFTHNGGGYATLSFIPTLGTMILGLIAGVWLRNGVSPAARAPGQAPSEMNAANGLAGGVHYGPWRTVGQLVLAGLVCLAAGWALDRYGICPSVKRIWTPAWTLSSGGWCFVILAAFFATLDVTGFHAWAFPLRVIGANSIAAYCIAHLWDGFIISSFKIHLSSIIEFVRARFDVTELIAPAYEPFVQGAAVLVVYWLILFWMNQRRIFLRI